MLCADEKPSIQALERAQGYLKLPNGRALTGQSHDYKRHGTTTLFSALEVATGKIIATHYLKAVKEAGTDEATAVVAAMKKMPVNDFMTKNGSIRSDGRMMRDMYLLQAKKPSESKGEWDLMSVVATIPANEAFRPLSESECPLK